MYSYDYTVTADHDHVQLYVLGDKFGITGLESVALTKFTATIKNYRLEDFTSTYTDWPGFISYVFTATFPANRGMREVVANKIAQLLETCQHTPSILKSAIDTVDGFASYMYWAREGREKLASSNFTFQSYNARYECEIQLEEEQYRRLTSVNPGPVAGVLMGTIIRKKGTGQVHK